MERKGTGVASQFQLLDLPVDTFCIFIPLSPVINIYLYFASEAATTSTYRHKLKTIKERTHRTQSKNQLREGKEHNKHKQIKTNTGKDTEDAVYLKSCLQTVDDDSQSCHRYMANHNIAE